MEGFFIDSGTFSFVIWGATKEQEREIKSIRLGTAVIDYCDRWGLDYNFEPIFECSTMCTNSELISC